MWREECTNEWLKNSNCLLLILNKTTKTTKGTDRFQTLRGSAGQMKTSLSPLAPDHPVGSSTYHLLGGFPHKVLLSVKVCVRVQFTADSQPNYCDDRRL